MNIEITDKLCDAFSNAFSDKYADQSDDVVDRWNVSVKAGLAAMLELVSDCQACPPDCVECSRDESDCGCYTHEHPKDVARDAADNAAHALVTKVLQRVEHLVDSLGDGKAAVRTVMAEHGIDPR